MTLNSIAGSASRNLRSAPHVVNARSYRSQRAAHLPVFVVATPAPRMLDPRTTKPSSELPTLVRARHSSNSPHGRCSSCVTPTSLGAANEEGKCGLGAD
jgi:hypothetical protein